MLAPKCLSLKRIGYARNGPVPGRGRGYFRAPGSTASTTRATTSYRPNEGIR